jgi:hypothetical protein
MGRVSQRMNGMDREGQKKATESRARKERLVMSVASRKRMCKRGAACSRASREESKNVTGEVVWGFHVPFPLVSDGAGVFLQAGNGGPNERRLQRL